jgi:hypothetical protein
MALEAVADGNRFYSTQIVMLIVLLKKIGCVAEQLKDHIIRIRVNWFS